MNYDDLFPPKYATKDWLQSRGGNVTDVIESIDRGAVGDGPTNVLPIVRFKSGSPALVLRKTNGEALKESLGPDLTKWVGATVELYIDPNVTFGGKRIGGVRVRVAADGIPF